MCIQFLFGCELSNILRKKRLNKRNLEKKSLGKRKLNKPKNITKQLKTYEGKVRYWKRIKRHEAEKRDRIFNLLFPFIPEPSLVVRESANLM